MSVFSKWKHFIETLIRQKLLSEEKIRKNETVSHEVYSLLEFWASSEKLKRIYFTSDLDLICGAPKQKQVGRAHKRKYFFGNITDFIFNS